MACLQSFQLAHLPLHLSIHVALYDQLKNADFLQQQLLAGNSEFEYAFIDASTIVSPNHLFAAVFRATNDSLHARLKSRNVHSEIVFALSPNNNIASSFRTFGITSSTSSLLVVKVSTAQSIEASTVSQHLSAVIEGTPIEFSSENLAKMTDTGKIRKIYKLSDMRSRNRHGTTGATDGVTDASGRKELEILAIGTMALRGQT